MERRFMMGTRTEIATGVPSSRTDSVIRRSADSLQDQTHSSVPRGMAPLDASSILCLSAFSLSL
jgi:hypothetical protein